MASKELVRLARKAAKAHAKANAANQEWADAFAAEYGHNDIDDILVAAIDYSTGNISQLTAAFIDEHSAAGNS